MNSIIDFKNKKYCVVTYGCQMNLHESEKISGILSGMGMSAVNEPENADVVVFNTCCIRDTAERRALGNIGKMKELKKKNKNLLIVVTGCMTQQNGFAENMKERYQYVDVILGTHNISDLENQIRIRLEVCKIYVFVRNVVAVTVDVLSEEGYFFVAVINEFFAF